MEIVKMPHEGNGHSHALTVAVNNEATNRKAFIEANTVESSLSDIRQNHIIPVFARDNEQVISQVDFIEAVEDVVSRQFHTEQIWAPIVRISHPIMGRIPEARNKPANQLESWEKTIYYERMAFLIEVPSICEMVGGERLSLTIGGVKAYNLDNLAGKKGSDEHFKVFIGFKVSVCTNLCVWTDGLNSDLRVKNLDQLQAAVQQLVGSFDAIGQIRSLERLNQLFLTEQQFAHLIGRCRMYQYLPSSQKNLITELQFGDSQINSVCRDYYRDSTFSRGANGEINLWRLYNLFTAANKASYIDTFLNRAENATVLAAELSSVLDKSTTSWYLPF